MKEHFLKRLIGFGLIIDIIIFDQLSKWLIMEYALRPNLQEQTLGLFEWFANGDRLPFTRIEILPFFNLVMVWNEGISFGLFQDGGVTFLVIVTSLIAGLFAIWLSRATTWLQAISLGMVIGGAIGNVIDRLHFGAVVDFLDFHAFGWHYPAFNVADSCITIGIALLVFDGVFLEPKRTKNTA